jgi:RNA recognition motif-containing protein
MSGIVRRAESRRHFPGRDYEIKQKEEPIMKIYVGNLPPEVTEEELRQEFGTFGAVTSVNIVKDKYSGRSRGFGFVEMAVVSEGQAAIAGVNGKALKGQTLIVNAARPPSESRGGGSYGDRRGGGPGRGSQRRY